jgi:hypothetical protein
MMNVQRLLVNPHPIPNSVRMYRVDDHILNDLIVLHRAGTVPGSRLRLAGIPPLVTLEAERQRRDASRFERVS